MIIISHRGNKTGPDTATFGENHPDSIVDIVKNGYDVELDVWFIQNKFYLGHDKPEYEVKANYLIDSHYWAHCKNIEALYQLTNLTTINCFFHNADDCTLTSKQFLWTFPRENLLLTNKSIAVLPELVPEWKTRISDCAGICTDFPIIYNK